MKKDKKKVFQHQLKTLENIEDKIKSLIIEHRKRKGSHLGVAFRTVIAPTRQRYISKVTTAKVLYTKECGNATIKFRLLTPTGF